MFRRVLPLFILLSFLVSIPLWALPVTSSPLSSAPSGIVKLEIKIKKADGNTYLATGSGVLIQNYILTAAHVLRGTILSIKVKGTIPRVDLQESEIFLLETDGSDVGMIRLKKTYQTDIRLPLNLDEYLISFIRPDVREFYGFGFDQNQNLGRLIGMKIGHFYLNPKKPNQFLTLDLNNYIQEGDSGGALLARSINPQTGRPEHVVLGIAIGGSSDQTLDIDGKKTKSSVFESSHSFLEWIKTNGGLSSDPCDDLF